MKLLSVREAAEHLDVPLSIKHRGRWLRRHLHRREEQTGRVLLVRVGGGRARPTYKVDLDAVRLYCPELISSTDKLARALRSCAVVGQHELTETRELLADMTEQLAIMAERVRRLEAKIGGRGSAPGRQR